MVRRAIGLLLVLASLGAVSTALAQGNSPDASAQANRARAHSLRPASARIPAGVDRVIVLAHGRNFENQLPSAKPHVLSGGRAARLVLVIDGLSAGFPAGQPGTRTCPAADLRTVSLRLLGAGSRPLATAIETPTGCAQVALRVGGRTTYLSDTSTAPGSGYGPAVTDALRRLGVDLGHP